MNFFSFPSGVPGVEGVLGVLGPDPGSPEMDRRAGVVLTMVMLRVTAGKSGWESAPAAEGGGAERRAAEDREDGNESYLRSPPRPESGVGPASVSSQSL